MNSKAKDFQIFNFRYEFTDKIWPGFLPQPDILLLFSTCKQLIIKSLAKQLSQSTLRNNQWNWFKAGQNALHSTCWMLELISKWKHITQ